MAYFEDLSVYQYSNEPEPGVLRVGWLGEGQPFQTGETSAAFQAALSELCNDKAILFCAGHHACEICPDASWRDPYYHEMGNGEIWVRDAAGIWYAAPRLIIHYVLKHGYCPPPSFIETVLHPSEIKEEKHIELSDEEKDRRMRDHERQMRELRGGPASEAEIDRIVRRGIPAIGSKRPWWRLF